MDALTRIFGESDTSADSPSTSGDALSRMFQEQPESFGKQVARTALQIPQGILEGTTYGLTTGLQSFLGAGEIYDPEEIERIRAISEREGIPFDEEKYLQAGQQALGSIPTVSNIAETIEERTGLPLAPKNLTQKGLRLASTVTKASPENLTFRGAKTALPRPVIGAGVGGATVGLQTAGVPEPIADLASFGIVKKASQPGIHLDFTKKKPSGLTERRYEKLKEETPVSEKTLNKINKSVENEFRDISNKIIEETPIAKTYQSLKDDLSFKSNSAKEFEKVNQLADQIPGTFPSQEIKTSLESSLAKRKTTGITPTEFDKSHAKFVNDFIKETPEKNLLASDLVTQYRKNNKALGEAYEPGQSFAYNRAKRDALQSYNEVIADMIEKRYPKSEFSKLFKETNKQWAEIMDAESITNFLNDLFKDRINFKAGRDFFDKNGMTVPFQRALGKEGFAKFETLLKDLMSTESANKLLKQADNQGFKKLFNIGASYLISPKLGAAHHLFSGIKGGYNKIFEMVLHQPQLAVTWDRGINAMKRGNFKVAETEFKKIEEAEKSFNAREKNRLESLKKFNQKKSKLKTK